MNKFVLPGIIGFILLIGGCNGCSTYNSMVTKQETVASQWSQVENVYQRRTDLIPNLVETVKGYANFERSTLTDVIEARASATQVKIDPSNVTPESLAKFETAQSQVGSALSRLLVSVEKYPDLKANQNFAELMAQLEGTENRITIERRSFNSTAEQYNKYIRQFPTNMWAGIFHFDKKAYFQATSGSDIAPKVKF